MPELEQRVWAVALTQWPHFHALAQGKDIDALAALWLRQSHAFLAKLLETDRRTGRASMAVAAKAHQPLLVQQLAQAVLQVAELWWRARRWAPRNFERVRVPPPCVFPG